jgi:hypothetical protein
VIYRRPEFTERYRVDAFTSEKREIEHRLRAALSANWVSEVDFEVGYDENAAFTVCGGIYTHRIICCDYLGVLHRVLRESEMHDYWTYSTSIELASPLGGMWFGGFLVQGNRLYLDRKYLGDFDFVKYFSRSDTEAAQE